MPVLSDLVYEAGLSEELVHGLTLIAEGLPSLAGQLKRRTLDLLCTVLQGTPYHHPGHPDSRTLLASTPSRTTTRRNSVNKGSKASTVLAAGAHTPNRRASKAQLIVLALRTLRTYDLSGFVLTKLARDTIATYLSDDNDTVREEACLTCAALVVPPTQMPLANAYRLEPRAVTEVLSQLLCNAISEGRSTIRKHILEALTPQSYPYLCKAETLQLLFVCLHDRDHQTQLTAMSLVGNLCEYNPAYVVPALRRQLENYLQTFKLVDTAAAEEANSRLLQELIRSAPRVVVPYVDAIMKALLPRISHANEEIQIAALGAVGELAVFSGLQLEEHLAVIMPVLLDCLRDHLSMNRRLSALVVLGKVARGTGYVTLPYEDYPALMKTLYACYVEGQSTQIRLEAGRALGVIGALDPHREKSATGEAEAEAKSNQAKLDAQQVSSTVSQHATANAPDELQFTIGSEEYYMDLAVRELYMIAYSPAMDTNMHENLVHSLGTIVVKSGIKLVPYLPMIVPAFLHMVEHCNPARRHMLFKEISKIVDIFGPHVRPYMNDIIQCVTRYWYPLSDTHARNMSHAFKKYVPELLEHVMAIIASDQTDTRRPTVHALEAISLLGTLVEDRIYSVIRGLVNVIAAYVGVPVHVRQEALNTLELLMYEIPIGDQASGVFNALMRVVRYEPRLRPPAVAALQPLPMEPGSARGVNRAKPELILKLAKQADDSLNFDWPTWIRRFSVSLLKESKSPSLAACQYLALRFEPFARKVFNAAFVSCWKELTPEEQAEMTDGLERAMKADHIFMQMMLNVAEFMSHYFERVGLPFSNQLLGRMALECNAYAKALRYKESELGSHFDMRWLYSGIVLRPVQATEEILGAVEDLIEITQALQQPEAAQGALTFVRMQTTLSADTDIQPSWYEKLGEWDKALLSYSQLQDPEHPSFDIDLRILVCLDNLGKWTILYDNLVHLWAQSDVAQKQALAPLGCSASCGLNRWESIATFLSFMDEQDPMTPFYGAVLAIHNEVYKVAQDLIDKSRDLLQPTLATLWGESYARGYNHVVTLQRLAEMEEVVQYKQLDRDPIAQDRIRGMWLTRLNGCQYNPSVWQRILEVRALVLTPEEDCLMWLKYASLCRKSSTLGSAEHFSRIGLDRCDANADPESQLPHHNPPIAYAYIKHVWHTGAHETAIQYLYVLIDELSARKEEDEQQPEDVRLLARCYHKLGLWQAAPHLSSAGTVNTDLTDELIESIIESFRYATLFDRVWYKAWHSWAYMNYEAVKHYGQRRNPRAYLQHAIMSIKGFFNSIALSDESSLQDTLRLLTLLFSYGHHSDVVQTFATGLSTVNIDTWLQVLPQLIARIQIKDGKIRGLLHELLLQVGRKHPQALLFPLTVAAHNHREASARRDAAQVLLSRMRQHSSELVEQALIVSEELIRVANLWSEKWFEGIEEASKLYADRQLDAMYATLLPLHEQLNGIGQDATIAEQAFLKLYGAELRDAWEWMRKYQRTEDKQDITTAWDHYFHVYRTITKALHNLTSLELKEVSPKLLEAGDLQLVVPGAYDHTSQEQVYIDSFAPQLRVINSKQRPRRLTIKGSNGRTYEYLLKANEDLRQDERVMQLFGLVNVLLNGSSLTMHKHLHIFTYYILPLSPKLGLIEWVPTCDTLHSLIKEYRERSGVALNAEVRFMLQLVSNMEQLTLIQKVEVFRHALSRTTGDDLARVMWLRSGNSEQWLERRGNFTRSLAVMSMVGYILGLGDRHPSNLMIDRRTGGVMHVDFGDCFEVATQRSKFPEKVPFRLTRMLIAAMEITGVHGTFRITCENTMSVLRDNADSVMAVLEAFIHDPLIDWLFARGRNGESWSCFATCRWVPRGIDCLMRGMHRLLSPGPLPLQNHTDEVVNRRALRVIARVRDKLTGADFSTEEILDIPSQVARLIRDATLHENLCQHYTGWCPFW
ncbi:uncharacterized protein MONBRDRAFT_5087 [Monosiga brevicollis MX1]|uniref:Serine/threonine-protein kinase TOR n=1 Tax=Monosiga brevicollis TaxID=81824 RepID=A9UPW2_MONBE|nr:uncharacterized protein MONBRDRAFT_5087 [Monosiga brevicollis MX1]EDQ92944.1 predicted protein [Monosiga brevicollis MX1]|eukprot:XP_001742706.1 hypothetical protein [Monosiga brevicollis MX1]